MDDIRVYDFKKSEKFSIDNVRHLALIMEEFAKNANIQINYETKNDDLKLFMEKSGQVSYGEFVENLEGESLVVEFNIEPYIENLALFVSKKACLTLVDLILGGTGKVQDINRVPTNIDLELIKYLFSNMLQRLEIPYKYDSIDIVKIYTNKAQYQKNSGKDMCFFSNINVYLENKAMGGIIMCIPYPSMEEVLSNIANSRVKGNNENEEAARTLESKEIYQYLSEVEIDICANLGTAKISIGDLINLEKGDVILLDQKVNEGIEVEVGSTKMYKAKPGVSGVKKAIELVDIINKER